MEPVRKDSAVTFSALPKEIQQLGLHACELWSRSVDLWRDNSGDLLHQARIVERSDQLADESSEKWDAVEALCGEHRLEFATVMALIKAHYGA